MQQKPEITAGSILIASATQNMNANEVEIQILQNTIGIYATMIEYADYLTNRYPSLGLTAMETKAGAEILKRKTEQLKEYLIAAQD